MVPTTARCARRRRATWSSRRASPRWRTSARRCARSWRRRASASTRPATFSKEREFLALREIINKKEKDILDLREDLDAKERQILDHKDKIRELDRARRDLEEKTLGFERSVVASTEKIAELLGERDKSAEREKGLKARLDDAHGEIHKARDEVEAIRKRMAQEDARAKAEAERARADFETRLREADEAHRLEVSRLKDEQRREQRGDGERAPGRAAAHRYRAQGRGRGVAEAARRRAGGRDERFTTEVARLRREHEKAIAASKEEQGLQLASERQAYEALTEAKERDHRNEILGMRRRHEEELTAAEERRQRDIVEQEQRRVAELDAAEGRRRAELQSRDENHHQRVTEIERRHLTEKTELRERHRSEHDQALGRAARAEGELAARVQEIDQAHRRLASLEADLDAARAEVGDRDVRAGADARPHRRARVQGHRLRGPDCARLPAPARRREDHREGAARAGGGAGADRRARDRASGGRRRRQVGPSAAVSTSARQGLATPRIESRPEDAVLIGRPACWRFRPALAEAVAALGFRRMGGTPALNTVTGNVVGLKPSQMHALERVYRRRLRPPEIVSGELAAYLCEVSREIERQVGILANRRGDVEHVFVGDASRITLPEIGRIRAGRGRFRGLRLVHTHLRNEPLTRDDLVDLALLRLDLVAAVGVTPDGRPADLHVAHLLPPVEGGQPWRVLPSRAVPPQRARQRGADRGARGGVRARRARRRSPPTGATARCWSWSTCARTRERRTARVAGRARSRSCASCAAPPACA